jgi:hypothetical protein
VYLKFSFIHLIDYPLFIDVSKCWRSCFEIKYTFREHD